MKTSKISDNHWLSVMDIPVNPSGLPRVKANHIWIYDRSGSMTYLLPSLIEDLIVHYRTIPIGDVLSLAWFSSPGQYRFILKGLVKTSDADNEVFARIMRENSRSIATTCFSEVLHDSKTVVKELSPICNNFAMMFFTDGYPVVPDYNYEIRSIFDAISAIKGHLSKVIFVGYGDYYNKELLSKMTVAAGGQLIHSSSLEEFSEPMTNFVGGSVRKRIKVTVNPALFNVVTAFTIDRNSKSISQYQIENDTFVTVDEDTDKVWFITSSQPLTAPDIEAVKHQDILDGMYASAMIFSQSLHSDYALSILGRVGDVAIIDQINSAFTNAEYGAAEGMMREAVFDEQKRFTDGRRFGYVPRRDRFCLLNMHELLRDDPEAKFYPFYYAFEYKRTGVKSKQKDGYPEFTKASENPGCLLNTLTWNESRLNISILAKIDGHVTLNDDCVNYGFGKQYPTWIYRNYTMVLDGVLHVSKLPASFSEKTHEVLVKNKLTKDKDWQPGKVFVLDLTRIPVMNREIADGAMTAKETCYTLITEKTLESALKVMKWKRNILDPDKVIGETRLSEEQIRYLKTQGIGNNGFSPDKEEIEPTDFYYAKEFDIKMLKFSSLPKVEVVITKDKSKLTPVESMMREQYDHIPDEVLKTNPGDSHIKLAIMWLDQEIAKSKDTLRQVRDKINRTKASLILAKRWFPDLDTREGAVCKIDDDGNEYTFEFSLRDIKVPY